MCLMVSTPINAVFAKCCKTFLISESVHQLTRCPCGKTFVDGGKEYKRRGGDPDDFFEIESVADLVVVANRLLNVLTSAEVVTGSA